MTNKKYEFGRHETFSLREGWLSKGLERIRNTNDLTGDVDTADALGLGRNMVRSLVFWMEAAGLAERTGGGRVLSDFASRLADEDPHFEFSISTWFAHLYLARRGGTVWSWFFNDFRGGGFDRATCLEAFHRHVRQHAANQTTRSVLEREVACLLATYAAKPPSEPANPEDLTMSPFHALGLLLEHHDTGRFEKAAPLDPVPLEAFLACVQMVILDAETASLPLSDLISRRNSPARLFNIDGDTIDSLAHRSAEIYGKEGVQLALLGSTRTITLPNVPPEKWYDLHFKRIGA